MKRFTLAFLLVMTVIFRVNADISDKGPIDNIVIITSSGNFLDFHKSNGDKFFSVLAYLRLIDPFLDEKKDVVSKPNNSFLYNNKDAKLTVGFAQQEKLTKEALNSLFGKLPPLLGQDQDLFAGVKKKIFTIRPKSIGDINIEITKFYTTKWQRSGCSVCCAFLGGIVLVCAVTTGYYSWHYS